MIWELITDRTLDDVHRAEELLNRMESGIITELELEEMLYGLQVKMEDPAGEQFTDAAGLPLTLLGENQNGAYMAADLNRVETAAGTLAASLTQALTDIKAYAAARGVGWDVIYDLPYAAAPELTTKKNWYDETLTTFREQNSPTIAQMARYLGNVKALVQCVPSAYPDLPESIAGLDYVGANAIEEALQLLDIALEAEVNRIKALLDDAACSWFYSAEIYSGEV